MSSSFLFTKPFFSKKLSASNPALYSFEFLALFFVLASWIGLDELKSINHSQAIAHASGNAIALIASWGIYSVRIASWVTILRRNRMPQAAEWLICLTSFAAMVVCILFSGPLVKAYASIHGYRFCSIQYEDKEKLLTFAKPQVACPAAPNGS